MFDAIVIGKGPAGVSASLYLKRAGFDVLVIGKDGGALEKTEQIENYYGLERPLSGKELIDRGVAQAQAIGIEVRSAEVTSIVKEPNFTVRTDKGSAEGKTLLLATGKSRIKANIKGLEALRGRGVSFCAVCDGFFYRGKRLGVIGSGAYAFSELSELTRFTKEITLFTNGSPLTAQTIPEGLSIISEPILSIDGTEAVEGVTTTERTIPLDGVFVAMGTAGTSDFALKLGVIANGNDLAVDSDFMTNVDGLYAAGDAIGGFLQIAKAVSDGALAAKSMIRRLKTL